MTVSTPEDGLDPKEMTRRDVALQGTASAFDNGYGPKDQKGGKTSWTPILCLKLQNN